MNPCNDRRISTSQAACADDRGTAASALPVLSTMNANWAIKAWVRQPLVLRADDQRLDGAPYSIGATPALRNLDLSKVDPQALMRVLALEAIRHWRSVGAYELHIVGRTCQAFQDEELPQPLAVALSHVAIDECHHHLAGQREVNWLQKASGITLTNDAIALPTFNGTSSLSPIEVRAAAMVAELTTSATFRIVPEDDAVDPSVREAIRAHRLDEGRHRTVFRMALGEFWSRSGAGARRDFSEALIDASSGLGCPSDADLIHWKNQLDMLQPPAASAAALERLARRDKLSNAVQSSGLSAELARAGVLSHAPTVKRFKRAGLIAD